MTAEIPFSICLAVPSGHGPEGGTEAPRRGRQSGGAGPQGPAHSHRQRRRPQHLPPGGSKRRGRKACRCSPFPKRSWAPQSGSILAAMLAVTTWALRVHCPEAGGRGRGCRDAAERLKKPASPSKPCAGQGEIPPGTARNRPDAADERAQAGRPPAQRRKTGKNPRGLLKTALPPPAANGNGIAPLRRFP